MLNCLFPVLFTFYIQGVLKLKKNNSGAKGLIKIPLDATVCRHLCNAESLYMFRVSPHPSSRVLKTVTTASGTGHNIGAATSLQRGQIGPI